MTVGDVVWARVTVERRPEGGTSWQVGGWARDDQMVPDGPLMRWLSGENTEMDATPSADP